MNEYQIGPDVWSSDTEALRARVAKAESAAQYWRSSAYHADRDRKKAEAQVQAVRRFLDYADDVNANSMDRDSIRHALDVSPD